MYKTCSLVKHQQRVRTAGASFKFIELLLKPGLIKVQYYNGSKVDFIPLVFDTCKI